MEPDQYLLSPEGEVLGPFWAEDVASWIAYDQLLPGTYVKQGEGGQWVPIFEEGGDDASGESSAEEENNDTYGGEDYKEDHEHGVSLSDQQSDAAVSSAANQDQLEANMWQNEEASTTPDVSGAGGYASDRSLSSDSES